MLLQNALSNVPVAQALNAWVSVLIIHVLPAPLATTRTHFIVELPGVMRHLTACSPAPMAKIASALTTRFASHTRRATRMIPSCADKASKMPRNVSSPAHQGLALTAHLGSPASLIRLVARHRLHLGPLTSLQMTLTSHTFQQTLSFAVLLTLMLRLGVQFRVQPGKIRSALIVSSAMPTPPALIEKRTIVDTA